MMPLLFSSLFSSGAGAPPPPAPNVPVSFVDGVFLANQTANGAVSLTLSTHQPGDMLVALTANRETLDYPELLPGYTDIVSGVEGSSTSLSSYRGYRLQTKIATSAQESINWTGAYGFLIALRGAQFVGRVAKASWRSLVMNWSAPPIYDLDTSGTGLVLTGGISGAMSLSTPTAPFQLLSPPVAAAVARNESDRLAAARISATAISWQALFWAVEFLSRPPAEVVLPAGAWRLDASRMRAGYAMWRAGMTVVNSTLGTDVASFVPTEQSFSTGRRYWEVECAGEHAANGTYNGYMGVVSERQRGYWDSAHPVDRGSFAYRGSGIIWAGSVQRVTGLPTFGKGAIVMLAFDPATGGFWVGKDGVWTKNPDTDPPNYAAVETGPWYPAIQGRDPNEGGTLRSLPSQFSYPVPSSCVPLAAAA